MKIEDIIVERIRDSLDMPEASLEGMRKAQIELGKSHDKFKENREIFDYVISCQVAVLFWVLAESGYYEDKNYKKGTWKGKDGI